MIYSDAGRKRLPPRKLSPSCAQKGQLDTSFLLCDHVLVNNFQDLMYVVVGGKERSSNSIQNSLTNQKNVCHSILSDILLTDARCTFFDFAVLLYCWHILDSGISTTNNNPRKQFFNVQCFKVRSVFLSDHYLFRPYKIVCQSPVIRNILFQNVLCICLRFCCCRFEKQSK